jgi:hypothetical protein
MNYMILISWKYFLLFRMIEISVQLNKIEYSFLNLSAPA